MGRDQTERAKGLCKEYLTKNPYRGLDVDTVPVITEESRQLARTVVLS